RFVIDGGGAVSQVAEAGSTIPDGPMLNCVRGGFSGLSFPAPESGTVTVVYPISFSDGGGAPSTPEPASQPSAAPRALGKVLAFGHVAARCALSSALPLV